MFRAAIAFALSLFCAAAMAQGYPTHAVKIVVPYGVGGSADVYARLLGAKLQETLGQPVVIENKPGGGAIVGTDAVAKADPDGYTLHAYADSIEAVRAARGEDRVFLIGHSHGGKIAPLYFADYTTRRDELDPWIASLRCWKIGTKHGGPHDDLRPRLAGMTAPTLVLTGKRDWLFPDKYARLTAAALPHATVTILEHSGHFGHVEEPSAFVLAVVPFIHAH